jgi:hypothetical protein
MEEESSIEAF